MGHKNIYGPSNHQPSELIYWCNIIKMESDIHSISNAHNHREE